MACIVVGGDGRGAGKTSLMVALIAGLAERRWTAVKISPESAGVELIEETGSSASGSDTARYRAGGAVRALLLRAGPEEFETGLRRLLSAIEGAGDVIIESNRVLAFVHPDVYLSVVGAGVGENKGSAERYRSRADVIVRDGVCSAELLEWVRARLPPIGQPRQ